MFILPSRIFSQVVTVNNAYISVSSGLVVNIDTVRNEAASTIDNAGSLNLSNLVNAGTLQGNGTYNISNLFSCPGTFTANNSAVNFTGITQNIPALTFYNLSLSGASGTKSALGNVVVNGALNISSSNILDLGANTLSGSLIGITGTGTLKTQNTSAAPIPANKSWSGAVYYNSASAQTIVHGNYIDLDVTGGNRTISTAGTIGISGIFTTGGGVFTTSGSTIDFNGSSAQNIPAFNFENITVSGGNTKTVNGTLNITGTLTLGSNTTLALGSYNIRLKSDSTYNARLATVPTTASITYGTGKFIAERYIKGRRKYRLITSPVNTHSNSTLTSGQEAYSIWGNWQNSGDNSTPNAGTFITGGSSSDGFDTQTTNASLFTYDASGRVFSGFTTANGKNTKYTPLKAGIPYYMFVWGDRTNSPIAANPNKTVLTATGTVLTGDQVYNTGSNIPLSNTAGVFTLIGNPYASAIDWAAVSKTNLSDTYWGWDPNLNSTGGYVTVTSTGTVTLIAPFSGSVGLNQFIQPGQAFFVKTTASSPVLTIHESDKVGNFNPNAFRTEVNNIPLIAVNLFYDEPGNSTLMDGALAAFDHSYSNENNEEDAVKLNRAGEELGILNKNQLLSIHARPLPIEGDTIFLNSSSLTKTNYRLQVFSNKMENSPVDAWLEDHYLRRRKFLSYTDTNNIHIEINRSVAASYAKDRFSIVFAKRGSLNEIIESNEASIRVYPNPVTNHQVNLRYNRVTPGSYDLKLYNLKGQLLHKQVVNNEVGTGTHQVGIPNNIPAGSYLLEMKNEKVKYSERLIIQ